MASLDLAAHPHLHRGHFPLHLLRRRRKGGTFDIEAPVIFIGHRTKQEQKAAEKASKQAAKAANDMSPRAFEVEVPMSRKDRKAQKKKATFV